MQEFARTRRQLFGRALAVAFALLAIGSLAAACGGSPTLGVASLGSTTTSLGASTAGNSGPPPSPAMQKAQLAYARCIQSHGVPNFPDPQAGGGFPNGSLNNIHPKSSQFLTAQKDYAADADAAGMAPPTKAEQEAHAAAMLKISECMQANGFPNFPDPNAEGGFMISNPASLGMGTPRYAKAAKKCDAPPGAPQSRTGG